MTYSPRLTKAFDLARTLHAAQTRKATSVPYITHLLAVAASVGEYGGDEDQVVAALLHDAVEDQGGAPILARIREQFGSHVADMVEGCTDTDQQPKPPWRARKEAHVAKVRTAPPELRIIIAADKLHNVTSMARDCEAHGIATLDRFNGGRDGTLWYYRAMLAALRDGWEHSILRELDHAVTRLHTAAGADASSKAEE